VIEAFGGTRVFQVLFDFGYAGRGKSFASGHATIGFLIMGLWFVLREARPRLARNFLLLGMVLGCLVGLTRIASGAHFASDVVWAGLIFWISAWILTRMFPSLIFGSQAPPLSPRRRLLVYSAAGFLTIAALFFTLLVKLQYSEILYPKPGTSTPKVEVLQIEAKDMHLVLRLVPESTPCTLRGDLRGFGWPSAKITNSITASGAQLRAVFGKKGYFSEYGGRVEIVASNADLKNLQILLQHGSIRIEAPPGTRPPRGTLRITDPQAPKPVLPAGWVLR
jgi:membrane-associated phospholipid phosphatase